MSKFVSIRGWVQTYYKITDSIESIVKKYDLRYQDYFLDKEQALLYQEGWKLPSHQCVNGIAYVFYGATIKDAGEDYIRDQILDILKLDDDIDGLFYVNDDEGESSISWEIIDSKMTVKDR